MRNFSGLLAILLSAGLLATALARAPKSSQSKEPPCFEFYSTQTSGVIGKTNFTGVAITPGLAAGNIPLYYQLSEALVAGPNPDGELFSLMSTTTLYGPWSFRFYNTSSWISVTLAFNREGSDATTETVDQEITEGDVNPVTGGTGCFLGIAGFIVYGNAAPPPLAVTKWTVCPEKPPRCPAGTA